MGDRDLIYAMNVASRYDNYLYPQLAKYVETYLYQNFDKVSYYARYQDIEALVRILANHLDFIYDREPINMQSVMAIVSRVVERQGDTK